MIWKLDWGGSKSAFGCNSLRIDKTTAIKHNPLHVLGANTSYLFAHNLISVIGFLRQRSAPIRERFAIGCCRRSQKMRC
jgi:hypothetical protein